MTDTVEATVTPDSTVPQTERSSHAGATEAANSFLSKFGSHFMEEPDDLDTEEPLEAEASDGASTDRSEQSETEELDHEGEGELDRTASARQANDPEEPSDERSELKADYTRKTQALAKEREEISKQRQDYLVKADLAVRMAYSGQNPILKQWNDLGPEGRQKLAAENPSDFVALKARAEETVGALQQMERDLFAHQKQLREATFQEESTKLYERIPEWKDQKIARAESSQVGSFLSNQGFSKEEIDGLMDSRAVAVARKAMLYDQMMAAQKGLQQKKVAPTPSKVLRSGNGDANRMDSPKVQSLVAKARKTGSVEDAAEALSARASRFNQ